jgi:hypothetical protein
MSPRIKRATAHEDFSVEIAWSDGTKDRVDFRPVIARGGVMAALADARFFTSAMRVEPDGYGLGWPTKPRNSKEVGGVDFSAQGLWYRAHPDKLAQDRTDAAE